LPLHSVEQYEKKIKKRKIKKKTTSDTKGKNAPRERVCGRQRRERLVGGSSVAQRTPPSTRYLGESGLQPVRFFASSEKRISITDVGLLQIKQGVYCIIISRYEGYMK
jgi:hypothetical protein